MDDVDPDGTSEPLGRSPSPSSYCRDWILLRTDDSKNRTI